MGISEGDIINALDARKDYILGNLENVTLKALRKDLESDLGLEKDALKPWKSVVSTFVDKLLSQTKTQAPEAVEKAQAEKEVKKSQQDKKGREFSARFLRMRNICKMATITVPVSVYRKSNTDQDMENEILDLLKKNGLEEKPEDGPRSRRRQATARCLKEASVSEEDEEDSVEEDEDSSEASGNDPEDSVFTAAVDDQDPPSTMKSKRPKLVVSSDEE
eukprot:jgi/Picre1/35674/NNA_003135.t1